MFTRRPGPSPSYSRAEDGAERRSNFCPQDTPCDIIGVMIMMSPDRNALLYHTRQGSSSCFGIDRVEVSGGGFVLLPKHTMAGVFSRSIYAVNQG